MYERQDWRLFTTASFALLLIGVRLSQVGGAAHAAASAFGEAALLIALGLLSWRHKARFYCWRSAVIGTFYVLHSLVRCVFSIDNYGWLGGRADSHLACRAAPLLGEAIRCTACAPRP